MNNGKKAIPTNDILSEYSMNEIRKQFRLMTNVERNDYVAIEDGGL